MANSGGLCFREIRRTRSLCWFLGGPMASLGTFDVDHTDFYFPKSGSDRPVGIHLLQGAEKRVIISNDYIDCLF